MEGTMYSKDFDGYQKLLESTKALDQEGAAYNRFGFGRMSDNEDKLNKNMAELRRRYRNRYETMGRPYPSIEPFYKMKEQISRSSLYTEVFRKMPKGGLLHVHSAAGLSVEGLLGLIRDWNRNENRKEEQMILVVTGKCDEYPYVEVGTMLYRQQAEWEKASGNKRESLEKYSERADVFLEEEGNQEWMTELLSFGDYSAERYYYRWDFFNIIFSRTSRLFRNAEFYQKYHKLFFLECMEDNIPYVELRCGFEEFEKFEKSEETEETEESGREAETAGKDCSTVTERLAADAGCTAVNYVSRKEMTLGVAPWENLEKVEFLDCIKAAQKDAEEEASLISALKVKKISVKVILCARRSLNPDDPVQKNSLLKKVDSAIVIRHQSSYQDLVIGFDFVSEEDRGQGTDAYAKEIIYGKFCEGYWGLKPGEKEQIERLQNQPPYNGSPRIQLIQFYLHDGESSWNSNNNVISAAIVSEYRIGHGFNMDKHPGCVRTIATNNGSINAGPRLPVLEVCPISNQLLGYYPDLRTHSAYQLMRQGVICCIASDDPQIFRNKGVSYDLWEAYMAWELELRDIKAMVYAAYYFYYTGAVDKDAEEKIKDEFNKSWDKFVEEAADALQKLREDMIGRS